MFCSDLGETADAERMLAQGRSMVYRFAVVHVASAEYELSKGIMISETLLCHLFQIFIAGAENVTIKHKFQILHNNFIHFY